MKQMLLFCRRYLARYKHMVCYKEWISFLLCIAFLSACSFVLKYDECDKDGDCSGENAVCIQGYCLENSGSTSIGDELFSDECTRVYGVSIEDADAFNENTILLGSVLPTSGDLGAKGTKMEQGIELAVDEINEANGILGKKVAVLFCDSATSSDTTQKALEHLISLKRVPAVIGPASSSVVIDTFAGVAKKAKLLMMSPAATSPQLTGLADDDLLWRTAPSDTIQGAAIANYLLKEVTFDRIAVINRDDAYGNGLRDAIFEVLCETFPCEDETQLYKKIYDEETPETDQSKIVVELEAFRPSITVLIGFFEDGAAFLELTKETEIDRFFLTDGLNSNRLGDLDVSDNQLCLLVGTQPGLISSTNYQSFAIRFNKKYGEVGSYTTNAYDATYLIAYAIAAANTGSPTGPDVAKGLMRLSEGEIVNAGTSNWNDTMQTLSSSSNVTVNYEGASGSLDFDKNGEAPSDIEGWAFNMDTLTTFPLGTAYSVDGEYTDVFPSIPGQGDACGNVTGKPCTYTKDCADGDYCDRSRTPFACTRPPTGQGMSCKTNADCEGYEANYCEAYYTYTCLKQGCSEALNDCTDDRICCDYAWAGLPSLCIEKLGSGGVCPKSTDCVTNDDCEEGTYCDLSFDPPLCVSPPFGQGEPCETNDDCLSYSAQYCDNIVANACLKKGCDMELNNCSEDYMCCDMKFMDLDILCVEKQLIMDQNDGRALCPCGTTEDCRDGYLCDTTIAQCVPPPTGQGETCSTAEDCESYEADYCDVDGSSTCLMQGCDATENDCWPNYRCCDFEFLGLPTLCIEEDRYETECP
jgi:branched-chain amino acid transport system substrate-binding protein